MKKGFWLLWRTIFALSMLVGVVAVDVMIKAHKKTESIGFNGNPYASDTLSYRFPSFSDFQSAHFSAPAALSMNEDGFVYSLKYVPNEASKIK